MFSAVKMGHRMQMSRTPWAASSKTVGSVKGCSHLRLSKRDW